MTKWITFPRRPKLSGRQRMGMAIGLLIGAAGIAIALHHLNLVGWLDPLQDFVFQLEDRYQPWIEQHRSPPPLLLLPIAFGGGLIASISPCILAMLPVNLSYIGTRDIRSRRDALVKAGLFVLGVATTLSLLGIFSSLAGAVLVQFRGYISVVVGMIIAVMGLTLLNLFRFPLPHTRFNFPIAGAYGFGLTFALVSSPCSSPVLLAILAASTATGSQILSVLTMISYALGYSAVIFCASVFTGLAKQARFLLPYSNTLLTLGGGILLIIGLSYVFSGIRWLVLVLR